jgi:hypothetical protein
MLEKNGTVHVANDFVGVSHNSKGDLTALGYCFLSYVLLFLSFILGFSILRRWLPHVYCGRVYPADPEAHPKHSGLLAWCRVFRMSVDEIEEKSNLDCALLIQSFNVALQICFIVGLPQVIILCPMHAIWGHADSDLLSRVGFANVQAGSWLCWVHAVNVILVVWGTMHLIYRAQKNQFLPRRFRWLRGQPRPRSSTVLVEHIPEEHNTDDKLMQYFTSLFSKEAVESAHIVKDTAKLQALLAEAESHADALQTLEQRETSSEEPTPTSSASPAATSTTSTTGGILTSVSTFFGGNGPRDATYYREELLRLDGLVREERAFVVAESQTTCSGFVTFKNAKDAVLALQVRYQMDEDLFITELPPPPSDVIWADLHGSAGKRDVRCFLGWASMVGIFLGYLPLVASISAFASMSGLGSHWGRIQTWSEGHPQTSEFIDGLLASTILTLILSFLPSILMFVFYRFFQLKADIWAQEKLHFWYFWFLMTFVVLITALGNSLISTIQTVALSPSTICRLLAEEMPTTTHFYMKYVVVNCFMNGCNLTRTWELVKFLLYRYTYGSDDEAKRWIEPEDQEFFGIGGRTARQTILMVIHVIFCSLAPIMTLFTILTFILARLIFPYMFAYAETRKADLGGVFWVKQMMHLQYAVFIYMLLMLGVLSERADTWKPFCVAASVSLPIWVYWIHNFRKLRWESLPFEEIAFHNDATVADTGEMYIQPELLRDVLVKEGECLGSESLALYNSPRVSNEKTLGRLVRAAAAKSWKGIFSRGGTSKK